jgi:hypothetical protein
MKRKNTSLHNIHAQAINTHVVFPGCLSNLYFSFKFTFPKETTWVAASIQLHDFVDYIKQNLQLTEPSSDRKALLPIVSQINPIEEKVLKFYKLNVALELKITRCVELPHTLYPNTAEALSNNLFLDFLARHPDLKYPERCTESISDAVWKFNDISILLEEKDGKQIIQEISASCCCPKKSRYNLSTTKISRCMKCHSCGFFACCLKTCEDCAQAAIGREEPEIANKTSFCVECIKEHTTDNLHEPWKYTFNQGFY